MKVSLIVCFMIIFFGFIFAEIGEKINNNLKLRKIYVTSICIILILQSGLRNVAVGADTYNYLFHFERVKSFNWEYIIAELFSYISFGIGKDPGYLLIQKAFQYITPSFQLFLLLVAMLFFISLGSFILDNIKKLSSTVIAFLTYSCLFYSFFSVTGIRQTIASAVTIWAYGFIKKRKFIPFVIVVLISSTIHKTSLLFLPFYFISNLRRAKIFLGTSILAFPVIFMFRERISIFLLDVTGYAGYQSYVGPYPDTFTLMFLGITLVSLWRYNYVIVSNKQNKHLYNALSIAVLLLPLTWYHPAFMRVVQYYSIFLILLIPKIIDSFRYDFVQLQKIIISSAVIILIIFFVISHWSVEYKFFWQHMELGENYRNFRW